jgi:hypothetical protein
MQRACLVLLALAACEKSAPEAPSSGQLSKVETDLMGYLPGTADLVLGGNFTKLQGLLRDAAFRGALAEQGSTPLVKWTDCFGALPNMTIFGSLHVATNQMRLVVSGIKLADLETCAKQAGFTATWDPDRKFIAIGGEGAQLGYFELPNKAIYQSGAATSRSAIEAELATTAKHSAASRSEVTSLVERADRAKSMWFAGTFNGAKLFGAADLQKGLQVDMTAEVPTDAMATEIVDGVDQLKDLPMFSSLAKKLTLKRSGKTLRITVDLDETELSSVLRLMNR